MALNPSFINIWRWPPTKQIENTLGIRDDIITTVHSITATQNTVYLPVWSSGERAFHPLYRYLCQHSHF